jgi:hypothetical protein
VIWFTGPQALCLGAEPCYTFSMTNNEVPVAPAGHTPDAGCNSDSCYVNYVTSGDSGDKFDGYQTWKRTASNTCRTGQTYGKDLCGDLDRTFGFSPSGRLG